MWRSLLFIPVLSETFLGKAHQRGADAIILDLEDSIAPERKTEARERLAAAVTQLTENNVDVVVRINSPWRLAVRDLEAAVIAGISTIIIPKAADAGHIKALDDIISELEWERGLAAGMIGLIALIETPAALLQVETIACASPRLRGLTLGGEDFALALGARPSLELLKQPCQDVTIAAKAAGRLALGYPGSIAEFRDLSAFRRGVEIGLAQGCEGGFAIHPAQVAVLNNVFTPAQAEIEYAQRVVDAYHLALQQGQGAVSLDGKMLDVPVVERARVLLARAAQFQSADIQRE
jgi:citrate lyase subunit beta/citryl-CoA lyase